MKASRPVGSGRRVCGEEFRGASSLIFLSCSCWSPCAGRGQGACGCGPPALLPLPWLHQEGRAGVGSLLGRASLPPASSSPAALGAGCEAPTPPPAPLLPWCCRVCRAHLSSLHGEQPDPPALDKERRRADQEACTCQVLWLAAPLSPGMEIPVITCLLLQPSPHCASPSWGPPGLGNRLKGASRHPRLVLAPDAIHSHPQHPTSANSQWGGLRLPNSPQDFLWVPRLHGTT